MVAILGVEFDTLCKIYQYLFYVTWYLYLTFFEGTGSWHTSVYDTVSQFAISFLKMICFNYKKKIQILIEDHTM